jgi:hypothetical protein
MAPIMGREAKLKWQDDAQENQLSISVPAKPKKQMKRSERKQTFGGVSSAASCFSSEEFRLMKSLLFVVSTIGILATSASARIGWTLPELEKNYGAAKTHVSKNFGWTDYDFTVGPLSITAVLGEDAKVAREEIVKISKEEFSEAEFKTILEKSGNGSSWVWDEKYTKLIDGKEKTWVTSVMKGKVYLESYLAYVTDIDPNFPVQGSFWMVNIDTDTQEKREKQFLEDKASDTAKGL